MVLPWDVILSKGGREQKQINKGWVSQPSVPGEQIPETIDLFGEKACFGLWHWNFQFVTGWPHCFRDRTSQ